MMNMKKVKKITISAIFCAISVIMLYVGSVTVLDYTLIAFASLFVVFAVIELGDSFPYLIYAVTSVLALLILPNKSTALLYAMFAGYYPIAKAAFERKHYAVSWILKFSLFNSALLMVIVVSNYVLHLPDTGFDFKIPVILLGNLTFFLYDITFSKLITLYLVKLRSLLRLNNYF